MKLNEWGFSMIAKTLERRIAAEARRGEAEMVQRFQNLRGVGLLPNSRGKNAEHLTPAQTVSGFLSIVSEQVAFAGFASKILQDLRPVGGGPASFTHAPTFGQALQNILTDRKALGAVREIRVSNSEVYKNSTGRGSIFYHDDSGERVSYYVRSEGCSLLQPGAEANYNPRDLISSVISETIYLPRFLKDLAQTLEDDKKHETLRASVENILSTGGAYT